ncbi:MAG: hypothetical protein O3B24_04145 [Verrucomicrobia bacterium]|nr:hypothetical protein [Verrucomicrobiota bacterium]
MLPTMLIHLHTLLFNPATHFEYVVSSALGAFTFALVMNTVGSSMGLKVSDTLRSFAVLAITLIVGLAAASMARQQFHAGGWVLWGAALLAVLAIAVPSTCLIQKGSYVQSLVSLVISLAAALVIVLLLHTVFGALRGGETSIGQGIKHNRETEQFIE